MYYEVNVHVTLRKIPLRETSQGNIFVHFNNALYRGSCINHIRTEHTLFFHWFQLHFTFPSPPFDVCVPEFYPLLAYLLKETVAELGDVEKQIIHEMDTTFCYTTQKIANGWVLLIWSEWWKQCTWIPVVIENKVLGSITPLQLCDCCLPSKR
jgi:hypothetical protein